MCHDQQQTLIYLIYVSRSTANVQLSHLCVTSNSKCSATPSMCHDQHQMFRYSIYVSRSTANVQLPHLCVTINSKCSATPPMCHDQQQIFSYPTYVSRSTANVQLPHLFVTIVSCWCVNRNPLVVKRIAWYHRHGLLVAMHGVWFQCPAAWSSSAFNHFVSP